EAGAAHRRGRRDGSRGRHQRGTMSSTDKIPVTGAAAAPAAPGTAPAAKPGRGVQVTERAAQEIRRVVAEHGLPADSWVRIGAKGGGCSGFTYVLDFDQT